MGLGVIWGSQGSPVATGRGGKERGGTLWDFRFGVALEPGCWSLLPAPRENISVSVCGCVWVCTGVL